MSLINVTRAGSTILLASGPFPGKLYVVVLFHCSGRIAAAWVAVVCILFISLINTHWCGLFSVPTGMHHKESVPVRAVLSLLRIMEEEAMKWLCKGPLSGTGSRFQLVPSSLKVTFMSFAASIFVDKLSNLLQVNPIGLTLFIPFTCCFFSTYKLFAFHISVRAILSCPLNSLCSCRPE